MSRPRERLTNIILLDVGVNQSHLRVVTGVFHGRFDDLVHWGNTRSTGDHEQVRGEVAPGVSEVAFLTACPDMRGRLSMTKSAQDGRPLERTEQPADLADRVSTHL